MDWKELYQKRRTDAARAMRSLRSGSRIFLGSGCGEPRFLAHALAAQADRLSDVEVVQVLAVVPDVHTESRYAGSFRTKQFFVAAGARQAISEGRADYTPVYLSDVPRLIESGRLTLDAALIQVSPPDEHGYLSLGVAVDVMPDVLDQVRVVIAQVNPRMPRTMGDSFVHVSRIHHLVEQEEPLISFSVPHPDEIIVEVAKKVARMIGNGATIQCGIGRLAQAVLPELKGKKDLGVHTDVLTEAYVDLVEAGAVTGAAKSLFKNKIVASFCLGGEKLWNFVNNNPQVEMHPVRLTNDQSLIAQNSHMTTVHEALEVDLTGQVCADAIGSRIYSGVGGMVDFLRGAMASPGGQALMVLTSTRPDGSSRIKATLSEGAGVGITRAAVRTVVTEYGPAYLHGLSIRERALALIDIAHPNHRDSLLTQAREMGLISPSQILVPLFTGVYPEKYQCFRTLKDGAHVFLRPVKPTDERLVQEFFYAMSDREVYYRFLHGIKAFPKKDMQKMVNVDYHREMTILALEGEFGNELLVGLARYVVSEDQVPEVDFAVRGDHQGRGLGRVLVHRLIEIAQERGHRVIKAYVMTDNQPSLKLLYGLGYAVTGTVSQGVVDLTVHFDQPVSEETVQLSYEQPAPYRESGPENLSCI
ncbi:MAG: GNAT family N-acetyltransferase [Deltaproteobacteria bacterium]|nr:GNAT family N-acetyltransferase [Deltaproteobacteria bacterium]